MGMLATVMNGLAMRDALVRRNIRTRLMSALPIGTVVESYSSRDAIRHLSQGEVCVLLREQEIHSSQLIQQHVYVVLKLKQI